MRWMRRAPMVVGFTVVLAIPTNALALVLAPPGHPGANQYVEVIPTSAGNAAPPGSVRGSGSATAGPQALANLGHGSSGDARLAKLGKEGQAAAALAASTAPTPARDGSGAAGGSASQGGSVTGGIANALTGSDRGGLGILLPLLLATALIAAVGVIAARLAGRPRVRSQ
jgi:hypothetical protein